MAIVTTNSTNYSDIADAIRAKSGREDTYTPEQMAAAIDAIETGGGGAPSPPALGFVPETWSEDGLFVTGTFYGNEVPKAIFRSMNTISGVGLRLKTVTFNNFNTIHTIYQNAFANCVVLEISEMPPNAEISSGAFTDCRAIETLRIPTTALIANQTSRFRGCTGLTTVTFYGSTAARVNADEFSGCTLLTTINVPWAQGAVVGAPWGATNATINYNYTE